MTYEAEVKDSIGKLLAFKTGPAYSELEAAYGGFFGIEKKDDALVVTVDRLKMPGDSSFNAGQQGLADSLRKAGIDAHMTPQYIHWAERHAHPDKNATVYSTDPTPHDPATNSPLWQFTVPDTLDSVLKLKSVLRNEVKAAVEENLSNAIEGAKAITTHLGDKEGANLLREALDATLAKHKQTQI